jgi:hypothetical protein
MSELMASDTGDLINCDDWTVIREQYNHHHRSIATPRELASTIRAGKYAWPGGYEAFFITSDGGVICHNCAIAEYWNIVDSMRRDISDGWRIVGAECSANTDGEINCDHCDGAIE